MSTATLMEWLKAKVSEAEKAVRSREQMAAAWRTGDDEMWNAVASMHATTAIAPPKEERMKYAETQDRIAAKCRHELEMFRETLAIIERLS